MRVTAYATATDLMTHGTSDDGHSPLLQRRTTNSWVQTATDNSIASMTAHDPGLSSYSAANCLSSALEYTCPNCGGLMPKKQAPISNRLVPPAARVAAWHCTPTPHTTCCVMPQVDRLTWSSTRLVAHSRSPAAQPSLHLSAYPDHLGNFPARSEPCRCGHVMLWFLWCLPLPVTWLFLTLQCAAAAFSSYWKTFIIHPVLQCSHACLCLYMYELEASA